MKTKSAVPTNQTTTIKHFVKSETNKLDTKVMDMMLNAIIKQVEDNNLYREDQGVVADYEQIQHAMDSIYQYLYDQKNSNVSTEDAQVFASYLVEKMKHLKAVVNKIAKK